MCTSVYVCVRARAHVCMCPLHVCMHACMGLWVCAHMSHKARAR